MAANVLAVEAAVGATTIVAIHVNHANRVGSFLSTERVQAADALPPRTTNAEGGEVCQEADQHSRSVRRNKHDSRDSGTKQSVGVSENKTNLLQAASTRWPSSANTLQNSQPYSISVQRMRTIRISRTPVTASASRFCLDSGRTLGTGKNWH